MSGLPEFTIVAPGTVAEALAARRGHPTARFLAGGTDLLAAMPRGLARPDLLIDLGAIGELSGIVAADGMLRIGAATTLAAIEADRLVARHAPAIAAAAAGVAGPAHREAATLGGNLCLDTRCVFYNQSDWWRGANGYCLKLNGTVCHVAPTGNRCHAAFSGDLAPVLLTLDAVADIAGEAGLRTIPLGELYREDGRAHLTLAPGEIVMAVRVPLSPVLAADYAKARLRGAIDFPLAGVAVALRREGDNLAALRVALTGTNPRPFLLAGTDELVGRPPDDAAFRHLDKLIQKQVSPMRTTLTPAHYRRRVASALASRLVRKTFAAAVPG